MKYIDQICSVKYLKYVTCSGTELELFCFLTFLLNKILKECCSVIYIWDKLTVQQFSHLHNILLH